MNPTIIRCSYPVGPAADPCGRVAISAYKVSGEWFYRCKRHDSPSVRAAAEERGYLRVPVAA